MTNGIAISQSGVPIKYSEDYQRTVDTRWKPVGIVAEYDVSLVIPTTYTATLVKVLDHNLGYVPAFIAPRQTDYLYPSPQSSPIGMTTFYADDTSIYYLKKGLGCSVTGKFYLFDFAINEAYDTGYKGTTMAKSSKSDYGLIMSDGGGRDVSKIEDKDLSLTTRFKNLSLAKIDFARTVSGSFTINHDIPYPPLIKISKKLEDNTVIVAYGSPNTYLRVYKETWSALGLADNNAYVNAGTIHKATVGVSGLGTSTIYCAYVILRDPSEIAQ